MRKHYTMSDALNHRFLKSNKSELSAEEFKAKMYMKLNEEGVFNKFRALLRTELVYHLQNEDPGKVLVRPKKSRDSLEPRYPLEAINWLVTEHLRRNGYDFTLSVFALESGSSNSGRCTLTIGDILTFLEINSESPVAVKILDCYQNPYDKLFLWKFFPTTCSTSNQALPTSTKNAATQTDSSSVDEIPSSTSVQTKLQLLEDTYDLMKRNLNFEDDLVLMKSHGVLDLNKILDFYPEPPKNSSVSGAEMRNFNMKVDQMRIALEDQYQRKVVMLAERKKEMDDSIRKQKNLVEQELSQQRQQILNQAEKLRLQEEEWIARKESLENELRLESERLEKLKGQLDDREELLKRSEAHHDQWCKEQKHQIEVIEKQKYESREFNLRLRESELKVLNDRLIAKLETVTETAREHEATLQKSAALKEELTALKLEAQMAQQENAVLKEQVKSVPDHLVMMKELHSLRETLRTVATKNDSDRNHLSIVIVDLLNKLTLPSHRITSLEAEIDRLRENCRLEKEHFTSQMQYLEKVVKESEVQKSDLLKRLQHQSQESTQLHKTIEHLRTKLLWSIPEDKDSHGSLYEKKVEKENSASDLAVDSHVTYFDTSITPGHLPPELKLGTSNQSNSLENQINFTPRLRYHPSIELDYSESRARIKLLEEQAEALKQKYYSMKPQYDSCIEKQPIKSIQLEDELPGWRHKSIVRVPSSTPDMLAKIGNSTLQTGPTADVLLSRLWTDYDHATSRRISANEFSEIVDYSENVSIPFKDISSTPLTRSRMVPEALTFRRLNFDISDELGLSQNNIWTRSSYNLEKVFPFSPTKTRRKSVDVDEVKASTSFNKDELEMNLGGANRQQSHNFSTTEVRPKDVSFRDLLPLSIAKLDGVSDKQNVDEGVTLPNNKRSKSPSENLVAECHPSQNSLEEQSNSANKSTTKSNPEISLAHSCMQNAEPMIPLRPSQLKMHLDEQSSDDSSVGKEKKGDVFQPGYQIKPNLNKTRNSTHGRQTNSDVNEDQVKSSVPAGPLSEIRKSIGGPELDSLNREVAGSTSGPQLTTRTPKTSNELYSTSDKRPDNSAPSNMLPQHKPEDKFSVAPLQGQINLDAAWNASQKQNVTADSETSRKLQPRGEPVGQSFQLETIKTTAPEESGEPVIVAKELDVDNEHIDDQISWEKSGAISPTDDFEW